MTDIKKELQYFKQTKGFPGGTVVKILPDSAGDTRDEGSIPGSGGSLGGGSGTQLQYSCLGNSLDRGTWWAVIPRVTKEQDTMEQLTTATLVALALFCQSAQNQCLPRRGEVSHGNE